MAEGDGERSQRREGIHLRDLSTVTCSKGGGEKEGGRRKKKKGSGKCFSNLSPVTRCLHGVIKGHLGFALKGRGQRIWARGASRGSGDGSEG